MTTKNDQQTVLLSYARTEARDRSIAEHLRAGLPNAAEADIAEGNEIADAAWVILLSPQAVISPWVNLEIGFLMIRATQRQTRIVPVLIDDVDPGVVPSLLRNAPWIDGRHLSPDQLTDTVRRAVAAAA